MYTKTSCFQSNWMAVKSIRICKKNNRDTGARPETWRSSKSALRRTTAESCHSQSIGGRACHNSCGWTHRKLRRTYKSGRIGSSEGDKPEVLADDCDDYPQRGNRPACGSHNKNWGWTYSGESSMRVKNRKCIRRLSFKSLWASRKKILLQFVL